MEILLLDHVNHDPSTGKNTWKKRSPLRWEEKTLNLVKQAVNKAANLSPIFFNTVCIANLDIMCSGYTPIMAYAGEQSIMWIHEAFFRESIQSFTVEELTGLFLHETAHDIQARLPNRFEKFLINDPVWGQTLKRFSEINQYNSKWFSEITADIYALQRSGKPYVAAVNKLARHICEHLGIVYSNDIFSRNASHLSIDDQFEILQYYCRQQDILRDASLSRMPMSARRSDAKYQTVQSTRQEEIGKDGRLRYFDWLAKENGGYDFLASLLKWHPDVEITDEWHHIRPYETNDAERQIQIRQFIHDILTLMKLLLGSSNLYVDDGKFHTDELPYGAVRANRSALTKTALHSTGSIYRIKQELQLSNLDIRVVKQIAERLDRLHHRIKYPSFEQQRDDIGSLLIIDRANKKIIDK